MSTPLERIQKEVGMLQDQAQMNRATIDAQALQIRALRDEVKRLTADLARASYSRAPLPATRTGRIGDDR